MPDLPTQFAKAKSKVEPIDDDKDNAAAAHAEVREVLKADPDLKEWDIETILIGSYKRHVSIRRVKDVDVLAKLPTLPADVTPADVLAHVVKVLRDAFDTDDEKRVKRQDRSVMVKFPEFDLHVDVVPARPTGYYLEIPDKRDDGTIAWKTTNPEQLTTLTTELNADYDDEYVPVVKLVRQTRRQHLGRKGKPGGLFFEILTYHAFNDNDLDASSTASLFADSLRSVATQLRDVVNGGCVDDPTMDDAVISVRSTDEEFSDSADVFENLATKADDALASDDRCAAAKAFRDIFGKNDDGDWVFELPAACNDDGTPKPVAVISAGDRAVPAGDGRFRVSDLRASIAAAREKFTDEFVARGFTLIDDNTLVGDVLVDGADVEHEVVVPADFPIAEPRVRISGGEGGRSWHRERDGSFCLWSDDEAAHLPWASADAVLGRIREWHDQTALGWPDDPPDLDLERYWPRSEVFITHGDLDEYLGRQCMVITGANSTYKLVLGQAPKKQRRIRSRGAVVIDVGELGEPLHDLDDLLDRLDADHALRLRSSIEDGSFKIIVVRYSRQGHVGSLGLHVRSRVPLEIVAARTAHTDDTTLRLRAGFDAEVLRTKRVAIVGVGAIGSQLADLLVRSGLGGIALVDADRVGPGNCIRHLVGLRDVGRTKVDAVADRLVAHGIDVEDIERIPEHATSVDLIERLFHSYDLMIDATGNGPATALVLTAGRVLQRNAISVCLQRGGTVARIDRVPLHANESHADPTPAGGPGAEGREGGCGDPISPAPPWACAAAAAVAAAVTADILAGRNQYPPTVVDVLVADGELPNVGTLR